ncbi:Cyclic phosphodiesterase [Nymphaea thermarum]|nr:Cyclic phosphodiesterase [Nymphaea thermarum]
MSMEGGEEQMEVYSVWAIPPETVRPRLKALMENLKNEFGGPEFGPHITMVGAIRLNRKDAIAKLVASSEGLKPIKCRISSVSKGTFFYQCIYLLVHPDDEVMEASRHCTEHFGYVSSSPYMPHLSLLYGDISEEEKDKAIEKAKALDNVIDQLEFEVSTLALYRTDTEDKTLESWELVADCKLRDGN